MTQRLRIATRQSPLAQWQARWVAKQLNCHYPNLLIELVPILTRGDKDHKKPLIELGGKAVFVKALQIALLNDEADIAVHCIKDMSVHEHPDLTLCAVLPRANPADVLISPNHVPIDQLAMNAVIGTGSPRRHSLLKRYYPHLNTALCRGNINTRIKHCMTGDYDGILLAAAGLERLQLQNHITQSLPTDTFIPAIGQGALGIECLRSRTDLLQQMHPLHDAVTACCIEAERTVNRLLGGDCHTAIGAHATIKNNNMALSAFVGSTTTTDFIHTNATEAPHQAIKLGETVATTLLEYGAADLISESQQ